MDTTNPHHRLPSNMSPVSSISSMPPQSLHRQANLPPSTQSAYTSQPLTGYTPQTQAPPIHGSWYSSPNIAAPQASHPIAPPPPLASQCSPPAQSEERDDTYLAVLGTQDPKQLRELLARSNPEIVMPLNAPGPLSQAVILTLLDQVHLPMPNFLCNLTYPLSSLALWVRPPLWMKLSSLLCGGFKGQPLC